MNFGTCATPDCDYRTEPESDHCLLCIYVMERQDELRELKQQERALRLQAQATVAIFNELFAA